MRFSGTFGNMGMTFLLKMFRHEEKEKKSVVTDDTLSKTFFFGNSYAQKLFKGKVIPKFPKSFPKLCETALGREKKRGKIWERLFSRHSQIPKKLPIKFSLWLTYLKIMLTFKATGTTKISISTADFQPQRRALGRIFKKVLSAKGL